MRLTLRRHCLHAMMLLITPVAFSQTTFVNTLMPLPKEVHAAEGTNISITPQLTFAIDAPQSDALQSATQRLITHLQYHTGIKFTAPLAITSAATVTIKVANVAQIIPTLGIDESYTLDTTNGAARITAPTIFGAYHAMETLLQLVQPQDNGYIFPAVHISDTPRFPWRGLMIDTGRHFMPVANILRTIDGMAAVKLNVLHFHLTEDQGFRIESKRFPKLTQMGSEGQFYTQEEIKQIVSYAAARGIRVVPEFDMPGHSTSWFVGYPELASAPGPYKVEHTFGVLDAAMDPTRDSTYEFIDAFIGEMTTLFPDEYLHIGGDESNGKQWRNNPAIMQFMKSHNLADTKALQAYFNKRIQAILQKHGRKMIGWDEILHPDLASDVVVQNWHGTDFLISAARQGHLGIYSQPYYLDHAYSAAQMYLKDPIPDNSGLTTEQAKLILGGEACMWAEVISSATSDSRIWPRTAAIAERFWSPQNIRDTDDMYRRLRVESLRLDALGLQHLAGPDRLLRQLSGDQNLQALKTLAATLSPPSLGPRVHNQKLTTEFPLTGMVDAVVFDPPLQHDLALWVDAYIQQHDISARRRLEDLFNNWITASAALTTLTPSQVQLQTLAPRIAELGTLGHIGLDAIKAYETKTTLTEPQKKNTDTTLDRDAKIDDSITMFVIIDPLRKLVAAKP